MSSVPVARVESDLPNNYPATVPPSTDVRSHFRNSELAVAIISSIVAPAVFIARQAIGKQRLC